MGVSVVLLTKNAEGHLRRCLESVRWADEIVALDGGSTDGTREILSAFGCRVFEQPADVVRRHHGNFDVARNRGFDLAREDWALVVDADEIVTDTLRDEILAVTRHGARKAYAIPRRNRIAGRFSRVLGDDHQLRLFPRGQARYEGSFLDARVAVSCPIENLTQPLVHLQPDSWRALLRKLDERTTQRARALAEKGTSRAEPALPLFYHTFRYYCREHDAAAEGVRGVLLAALYAAYPAVTEAKLRRRLAQGERRT